MQQGFKDIVCAKTGAVSITKLESIQSLWSGYGEIARYRLEGVSDDSLGGANSDSVVVKHVVLPAEVAHPKGWQTPISHARKIRSYAIESAWYRDYSDLCSEHCRVPACIAESSAGDEFLIVMKDLDALGFSVRRSAVSLAEAKLCIYWLAHFHAKFMNVEPEGLWPVGTYWHLETRPDELAALEDEALKNAAPVIDSLLTKSLYQTIVHGDAKLANFCFSDDGESVAAVDFQYVGAGCGMKDLAYFIGSCFGERECELHEQELLGFYFETLRAAFACYDYDIDPDMVERDWRPLYYVAWTDFHRFVKGWSPGHWKIHGYSERISRDVISRVMRSR